MFRQFSPPNFCHGVRLRRAIVGAKNATNALAPLNPPAGSLAFNMIDELVTEALMVVFAIIVDNEQQPGDVFRTLRA